MYSISIIFEGICFIEKLYNIFIPTDARQASVIAGLMKAMTGYKNINFCCIQLVNSCIVVNTRRTVYSDYLERR